MSVRVSQTDSDTNSLGNASARSGLWRNTHQIWDMMTTFGEVIDIYSPVHNRLISFVSFKTEDALENALARKEASIGGTRILLSRAHFKDDNGASSFVSQTSFAVSTHTSSSAIGGGGGGGGEEQGDSPGRSSLAATICAAPVFARSAATSGPPDVAVLPTTSSSKDTATTLEHDTLSNAKEKNNDITFCLRVSAIVGVSRAHLHTGSPMCDTTH